MTKDVIECIEGRRSVRSFNDEPVMDSTIGRLLEAAIMAPSGGNVQPWFFYVVKNDRIKQELSDAAFGQPSVAQAPVVIVVCANPQESAAKYQSRGSDLYCLQDTAAATQNILLTAYAYGLGTCWVGAFDEAKVRTALDTPQELRPVTMIPIGVPKQERKAPARKSVNDVVKVVG